MIALSELQPFRALEDEVRIWGRTAKPGDQAAAVRRWGLFVIVSVGMGWEHASVSVQRADRCPTWSEMSRVARWLWPTEVAMQLHVPAADHVNVHQYCLHLWRPTHVELPTPPKELV